MWTCFHGRFLAGGEPALREAREHGLRPRVDVQWGKHGSMPVGWQDQALDNEATCRTLHERGRRLDDHDGRDLRGVDALANQLSVQRFDFPPAAADQNTQRLGVIVITPPSGR